MLEKAPHKFHDIQYHGSPTIASGLFISKKDIVVFDFNDATV